MEIWDIDKMTEHLDGQIKRMRSLLSYMEKNVWNGTSDQVVGAIVREMIDLITGAKSLYPIKSNVGIECLGRTVFERAVQVLYILGQGKEEKEQRASAYECYFLNRQIELREDEPIIQKKRSKEELESEIALLRNRLKHPSLTTWNQKYKQANRKIRERWYRLILDDNNAGIQTLIRNEDRMKELYHSIYKVLSTSLHGELALVNYMITEDSYLPNNHFTPIDLSNINWVFNLIRFSNNEVYFRIRRFYKVE